MYRTRDWRRAQRAKAIARVKEWMLSRPWYCDSFNSSEELHKAAAWRAQQPTDCSGPCCGNPRRHFGEVTMQEKRAPRCTD